MSLGIFVEGPSDRQAIPILIRKVGYLGGVESRVVSQGEMLDASKMSAQVRALLVVQRMVDRIIVFRDSEGTDPQETLRLMEPVYSTLNAEGRVPVDYVVVDHSLEGWLACDIDALRAVLGRNARIRTGENPDDNPRPARLMERIFKANGKTYRKTVHAARIAEAANWRNISKNSITFRRLVRLLRRANT